MYRMPFQQGAPSQGAWRLHSVNPNPPSNYGPPNPQQMRSYPTQPYPPTGMYHQPVMTQYPAPQPPSTGVTSTIDSILKSIGIDSKTPEESSHSTRRENMTATGHSIYQPPPSRSHQEDTKYGSRYASSKKASFSSWEEPEPSSRSHRDNTEHQRYGDDAFRHALNRHQKPERSSPTFSELYKMSRRSQSPLQARETISPLRHRAMDGRNNWQREEPASNSSEYRSRLLKRSSRDLSPDFYGRDSSRDRSKHRALSPFERRVDGHNSSSKGGSTRVDDWVVPSANVAAPSRPVATRDNSDLIIEQEKRMREMRDKLARTYKELDSLNEKVKSLEKVERKLIDDEKAKEEEDNLRYIYRDGFKYWCESCNIVSTSIGRALNHLHTPEHINIVKASTKKAPWFSEPKHNSKAKAIESGNIKGVEFLFPAKDATYCELCRVFSGDLEESKLHIQSRPHHIQYQKYTSKILDYDKKLLERMQAQQYRKAKEEEERQRQEEKRRDAEKLVDSDDDLEEYNPLPLSTTIDEANQDKNGSEPASLSPRSVQEKPTPPVLLNIVLKPQPVAQMGVPRKMIKSKTSSVPVPAVPQKKTSSSSGIKKNVSACSGDFYDLTDLEVVDECS